MQSLVWWEDQHMDVDGKLTRKKIFFKEQNRSRSTNPTVNGQTALDEQGIADKQSQAISCESGKGWKSFEHCEHTDKYETKRKGGSVNLITSILFMFQILFRTRDENLKQ